MPSQRRYPCINSRSAGLDTHASHINTFRAYLFTPFTEVAAKRGLTREEFWLQVMQRNFNQLLESNADGRSMLDDIFSEALGVPVTVWEVEATIELHADRKLPGLIIQSQKVVDPLGRSAAHELAHWEILSRIATALMDFTRADWAIFSIGDGKSDFLLPLLREVKKEEADDA